MAAQTRRPAGSSRTPEQLSARIRKARMELGLSLAAVAQTDFSRAYLNQIELGRARPSARVLQILSERLNRPVEYFLEEPQASATVLELKLAEAGTRIKQGDALRARELMSGVLALQKVSPEIRARAQLVLAEAHLKLREISQAIDVLQIAIDASRASGWRTLEVDLYDRMGQAYYLLRRPHEAGRWWDKALTAYEDADLADPLLRARILGHRANFHYVAGEPREAIAGYQSAIHAAEKVLDMPALGGIYEGLALSFEKVGDLSRALEYAQRSLRLFETLQDVRMCAQLRTNMGEILLSQGRPEDAEALFLEGLEQLRKVGDKELLPHLLAGAAEAALNRGDQDTATSRVAMALTACEASSDPLAALSAERIAGRIMHASGHEADARAHFDRALELATAVGSPLATSRVAFDYAEVLKEQGDAGQALARYRQAYQERRAAELS